MSAERDLSHYGIDSIPTPTSRNKFNGHHLSPVPPEEEYSSLSPDENNGHHKLSLPSEEQYMPPNLTEKTISQWFRSLDLMWEMMQNPEENRYLISDMNRGFWEYHRFQFWKFSKEFLKLPKAPKNEGEKVLMAPGYFASSLGYMEISSMMKSKGHHPRFSYSHLNEFSWDVIDQMKETTLQMLDENDGEPFTLYAHSKGGMDGILVGEMIKEKTGIYPFKKHIDIASPIYLPVSDASEDKENALHRATDRELYNQEERNGMTLYEAYAYALSQPKENRHLSIRDPKDPVIPEKSSTTHDGDGITIDINSSHIGSVFHPEAIKHTIRSLSDSSYIENK